MKISNSLKENKKQITSLGIKSYKEYLDKLPFDFVDDVFNKFCNNYDINSGLNPELSFLFFLSNKILKDFSEKIKDDNLDLEIELLSNERYIKAIDFTINRLNKFYIINLLKESKHEEMKDLKRVLSLIKNNLDNKDKNSNEEKHIKNKDYLYEYFSEYTKEEVDEAINNLNFYSIDVLRKYDFEDLDKEKILMDIFENYDEKTDIFVLIVREVKKEIRKKFLTSEKTNIINEEELNIKEISIEHNSNDILQKEYFDVKEIIAEETSNQNEVLTVNDRIDKYINNNELKKVNNDYYDELIIKYNLLNKIKDSDVKLYIYLRYGYYKNICLSDEDIINLLNISIEQLIVTKEKMLNFLKEVINENIELILNNDLKLLKNSHTIKA